MVQHLTKLKTKIQEKIVDNKQVNLKRSNNNDVV